MSKARNNGAAIGGMPPIEGSANLEQIRDLLFGDQSREFEQRVAQLESRLAGEVGNLREFVRNELDGLMERLAAVQSEHTEVYKELDRAIEEAAAALDTKIAQVDLERSQAEAGLRQQLQQQIEALGKKKTDRAWLGALLHEISVRLTEDPDEDAS